MTNKIACPRSAAGWPPGAPATPAQRQGQGLGSGREARSGANPRDGRQRGLAAAATSDARYIAVEPGFEVEEVQKAPRTSEQAGRPRHLPLKRGSRVRVVSGGTVLTGLPLPGRNARRAANLQISRVPSKMCASDICLAGQRPQGDPGPQAVPIAPPIRAFARSTVGRHDVCRWVVRTIAQCVHARPECDAGRQATRVLRRHLPPHRP